MQGFCETSNGFAEAGAQVLGVSIDTFASAEAFRADLGADFALLGDWPLNATGEAYGVFDPERRIHRRTTFVLDRDHVVRAIIDDPRDFERHAVEALEAVKMLG